MRFGSVDLGVIQTLESGVPYGAVGAINTIPYSPAGLYLNPSGNRPDGFWDYYFTEPRRVQDRSELSHRPVAQLRLSTAGPRAASSCSSTAKC